MKLLFIILSLFISPLSAGDYESCAYSAKETPGNSYPDWRQYEDCAIYTDGKLTVHPAHREQLDFDSSGLASIRVRAQYFYVREDGSFLPVIDYDNGADTFREGLCRSLVDGKIAYFNADFERVISPKYDWGWPFSGGRALVCSGCRQQKADADGHSELRGGLWGYIDKQGIEIIPVKFSLVEIRSM